MGAFQPAKIGMLFGQRIVDNVSPEKQEQRLGVGAREADREAAAAVDEEVSGGVQGECFGAEGKAAGAGKKGQDTGAGDMFGAGVWGWRLFRSGAYDRRNEGPDLPGRIPVGVVSG